MYIERDIAEELSLIEKIRDEVDGLAEIIGEEEPGLQRYVHKLETISNSLNVLKFMFEKSNTYIELVERETGKAHKKYFSEGDYGVFREASHIECFSDIDDTYEIKQVVFEGRPAEYCGWMPGMHFIWKYKDTKEVAYENWFENWDH